MSTLAAILIAAGVTLAVWLGIEAWAWFTGRKLITDVMRTVPRAVVGIIMFCIGALFAHFWWVPACVS